MKKQLVMNPTKVVMNPTKKKLTAWFSFFFILCSSKKQEQEKTCHGPNLIQFV